MDEESVPSSGLPTSFTDLSTSNIKPLMPSPTRRLNRRLGFGGGASPKLHKIGLSSGVQTTRNFASKSGLKRKECDSISTPDETKSRVDQVAIQKMMKSAVEKQETGMDLVGDCSRSHRLPTITGQQQYLHYITPATMVDLITGRISLGSNTDYKIIDCRYPYEYDGGHLPGALNLHTQEKLTELVKDFHESPQNKNTILIFHCEFSSERGPKCAKFLRNLDRQLNADKYPFLNFPEIYIMKGGYKDFYDQYSQICMPRCYIPMLHEDHRDDLKKFRSKSKSWSAGDKPSQLRKRSKKSRLMFEC